VGVSRFVHTGVVVEDLAAVVEFLTLLGLRCGEPMIVEGEWVDRIVDLPGVRVEVVMVRLPDGTDTIELAKFHAPTADADPGAGSAPPNRPGIRHIAYGVDDMRAVVDRVRAAGWDTVGEVVDYAGAYLLCYVRGPEGLIVELAEPMGSTSA
jgi:catechol 2,3-dioxygenase-like lactoylglutathione lyase family enzyme